jgi:RNA polymerase sigma factor (sigma-70 family)
VTRDVQLSEDIAQETFLTVWQRLGRLRNPDAFLPWLRQVARHRAIDEVRSGHHRSRSADDVEALIAQAADPHPGPQERLSALQDSALLAEALDEIPEESREVLLLFYREGESSRDVAALLGLTEGAVRKRLQRARASLRAELLSRFATAAGASAPGLGFTAAVSAGLTIAPAPASASGLLLKTGLKALLSALGALAAAVGLVLAAVALDVRIQLKRAKTAAERRALLRHGLVYAALMGSYMAMLWWSKKADWTLGETLAMAGAVSALIMLLAVWRKRIVGRHRE